MKFLITSVLFSLIILSCKERYQTTFPHPEKTFNKYLSPTDSFWYNIKTYYDSIISFKSIENGLETDSIEFRFWIDGQLSYWKNVLVFKFENNHWTGENIFFIPGHDQDGKKRQVVLKSEMKIDGNDIVKKRPINLKGDSSLTTLLTKHDLLNLTVQRENAGGCCVDGVVYFFEIGTRSSYKFCSYSNPQCCQQFNENKGFLDFVDHLLSSLPKNESCWPICSTNE